MCILLCRLRSTATDIRYFTLEVEVQGAVTFRSQLRALLSQEFIVPPPGAQQRVASASSSTASTADCFSQFTAHNASKQQHQAAAAADCAALYAPMLPRPTFALIRINGSSPLLLLLLSGNCAVQISATAAPQSGTFIALNEVELYNAAGSRVSWVSGQSSCL